MCIRDRGVPNLSISGMTLSIAVVVPFLNMTKQFCGQIGQISQQINAVVTVSYTHLGSTSKKIPP